MALLETDASNRVWFSKEARWLAPSGLVSIPRLYVRGYVEVKPRRLTLRRRARIIPDMPRQRKKNAAAVALGRKGARKGGLARAASMTPEERSESARQAVAARWARYKEKIARKR